MTEIRYEQSGKAKKTERIELPPSERLVYGIQFCFAALAVLTVIEVAHIAVLRSFNSEVFSAITGLVGTVVGVFISKR